ncbi:MAG: YdeI/OmpD-associated family protein [Acidobacteria bacterium]|nr:YdeI/OmpD-associated family protein [Acidobacteriota bacterium]MCB9397910.1 YdeI/OmpD-associated family protein [Acidobacteriota bacterium]
MPEPHPLVDAFLLSGCGRCDRGGTPDCKVHRWPEVLRNLRALLLQTNLTETLKWGFPCYTWQDQNVVLLSAFNERCTLSFFHGAILNDPQGYLQKPGENTQGARILVFTESQHVSDREQVIREFVDQAINAVEKGERVEYAQQPEPLPETLSRCLIQDPTLKQAFEALSPGRKRSYILHVSAAKQEKTQLARIAKCRSKILAGKGFHDRD